MNIEWPICLSLAIVYLIYARLYTAANPPLLPRFQDTGLQIMATKENAGSSPLLPRSKEPRLQIIVTKEYSITISRYLNVFHQTDLRLIYRQLLRRSHS
jgi:hypothetical protein